MNKVSLTILIIIFTFVGYSQEEASHPELDWYTIETENFYVHYHYGAERTAQLTAKIAEEIYGPITSLYNYKPDQKVSWIIKDYDDYSNGASYFFDNKIEIWATSMDFDLRGTHNWLRNVITHEFTHIIQIQTSMKFGRRIPAFYLQWLGYEEERRPDVLYGYPNVIVSYPISGFVVPAWFAEGTAQLNHSELQYDFWDSHRDMILRMYTLDGNMLTWNEMSVFGKSSLGNESSYNAGFALVSYIANKYGIEKVVEISKNLSTLTEYDIDGAIKRALNISGKELYKKWQEELIAYYSRNVENIKNNIVEGEIIAGEGFGNLYPIFSPDGKKIAYVSNKDADYFALSALYLYDLETGREEKLKAGIRSSLSWHPKGDKIFYAKNTSDNKFWSSVYDIYFYDLKTKKEKRITFGRRAQYPSISPDAKKIVFVSNKDGTTNLVLAEYDDSLSILKNEIQLTDYSNGEQVFNPKWSPDGKKIIFDYSVKDGRDIAVIDVDTKKIDFIFSGPEDTRSGVFSDDGEKIFFVSDETGIFNIYEYDIKSKIKYQLTNLLGGAFMPSVSSNNYLVFANYKSSGYKISLLKNIQPIQKENINYVKDYRLFYPPSNFAIASTYQKFDWNKLNSYDDTHYEKNQSRKYKNIFTSLTVVPFFRIDNYNPKNKGVDIIKPGLYAFSRDVLEKVGLFAGAAFNRKFERDLFLIFDYSGKLPIFYQIGLDTKASVEIYNITRKASAKIMLPEDTISVGVNYNLLEFDLVLNQKVFKENINLEIRYAHSRYSAGIDNFVLKTVDPPMLVPGSKELYLVGNDLASTITIDGIVPSTTSEINPIGRKIQFKYNYEFNKFNSEGEYTVENGILIPKYSWFKFSRVELNWKEYFKLPIKKHTLALSFNSGFILGPAVDNFFDYYIGGLAGMKGYPFYSLGGNEYIYSNLTYRFPIFPKIDLKIFHLYFDKLYGAFYGDVGAAWTGGSIKNVKFKRDAGFELRLESYSWYSFPTRIFFNASYGFDKFDKLVRDGKEIVTYGKEWSFYFGVLFGFELY